LSYILVADEAFPLSMYIMRPYSQSGHWILEKKSSIIGSVEQDALWRALSGF